MVMVLSRMARGGAMALPTIWYGEGELRTERELNYYGRMDGGDSAAC